MTPSPGCSTSRTPTARSTAAPAPTRRTPTAPAWPPRRWTCPGRRTPAVAAADWVADQQSTRLGNCSSSGLADETGAIAYDPVRVRRRATRPGSSSPQRPTSGAAPLRRPCPRCSGCLDPRGERRHRSTRPAGSGRAAASTRSRSRDRDGRRGREPAGQRRAGIVLAGERLEVSDGAGTGTATRPVRVRRDHHATPRSDASSVAEGAVHPQALGRAAATSRSSGSPDSSRARRSGCKFRGEGRHRRGQRQREVHGQLPGDRQAGEAPVQVVGSVLDPPRQQDVHGDALTMVPLRARLVAAVVLTAAAGIVLPAAPARPRPARVPTG